MSREVRLYLEDMGDCARDVLIHSYFGLELETLWDVVKQEVPPLLDQIENILAEDII